MGKKLLLAALALAALAGGVATQRWLAGKTAREQRLDFSQALPGLDGGLHSLGEWRGKILIVNFWASWCPPCVDEMPEFFALQEQLRGQNVQFVGVLLDDDAEAARAFLKQLPVNYPMLDGTVGGRLWAARAGDAADVLPFSAVYDGEGRLVHAEAGRFTREEVLARLAPLLGGPGGGR